MEEILKVIKRFLETEKECLSENKDPYFKVEVKDLKLLSYNKIKSIEHYILANPNKTVLFTVYVNNNFVVTEGDTRTEYVVKAYNFRNAVRSVKAN